MIIQIRFFSYIVVSVLIIDQCACISVRVHNEGGCTTRIQVLQLLRSAKISVLIIIGRPTAIFRLVAGVVEVAE